MIMSSPSGTAARARRHRKASLYSVSSTCVSLCGVCSCLTRLVLCRVTHHLRQTLSARSGVVGSQSRRGLPLLSWPAGGAGGPVPRGSAGGLGMWGRSQLCDGHQRRSGQIADHWNSKWRPPVSIQSQQRPHDEVRWSCCRRWGGPRNQRNSLTALNQSGQFIFCNYTHQAWNFDIYVCFWGDKMLLYFTKDHFRCL